MHAGTGFTATLWHRLEHEPTAEVPAEIVGDLLHQHQLLAGIDVELPDFRVEMRNARRELAHETRFPLLRRAT